MALTYENGNISYMYVCVTMQ